MHALCLGIDVGKDELAYTLMNREREILGSGVVPRTGRGLARLLHYTPPTALWVMEPTGQYSTVVAQAARDADRPTGLAAPRQAKKYLASLHSRAKCDRLDSRGLAMYGLDRKLPEYPLKDEATQKVDQLLAARASLVDARMRFRQQAAVQTYAAPALHAAMVALSAQIKSLERELAQQVRDSALAPTVRELVRVPGIAHLIATATANVLEAKQFVRADAFVAYLGLDVQVLTSGHRKGERGLTKQGPAELRRLLFLGARAAVRTQGSPFREPYEQALAQGRSKTAAANIIARRLARVCWSIHRYGSTWEPERVFTDPHAAERAASAALPGDNSETSLDSGT